RERDVSQREIHLAQFRKLQSVRFREARIAISARHEVLPETSPPMRRLRRCVGNRLQVEPPGIVPTHEDRKRVFVSERRAYFDLELVRILLFHLFINRTPIGDWRVMKYRSEGRAGVFGIEIE